MSRTIRIFASTAAVAAAFAVAGAASAAPPPGPAEGSVGPGIVSNVKAKGPKHRVFRITNLRANASVIGAASGSVPVLH
jgi:hypothetical protein